MSDRSPARMSGPSAVYDAWKDGNHPSQLPEAIPSPMGIRPEPIVPSTIPSAVLPSTDPPPELDLIPGATLREWLERIECKVDGVVKASHRWGEEVMELSRLVRSRPCIVPPAAPEPECPLKVVPAGGE